MTPIIRHDPLIRRLLRPVSLRLGYWRQSIIRKAREQSAKTGWETHRANIRARNPFGGMEQ